MGKILSGIFVGLGLAIIVGLILPSDANVFLLAIALIVGCFLGSTDSVSKIFDSVIESRGDIEISKVKRVVIGVILSILLSSILAIIIQDPKLAFLSLPFTFLFGYSSFGSRLAIGFWERGREERQKNSAIREQYDAISKEEYAKEKGRLEAQRRYGDSSDNRPIHIHVSGSRRRDYDDDFSLKTPQELKEGYLASERRAGQRYRDAERDMRRKI
jgi:hypothetical protein